MPIESDNLQDIKTKERERADRILKGQNPFEHFTTEDWDWFLNLAGPITVGKI